MHGCLCVCVCGCDWCVCVSGLFYCHLSKLDVSLNLFALCLPMPSAYRQSNVVVVVVAHTPRCPLVSWLAASLTVPATATAARIVIVVVLVWPARL